VASSVLGLATPAVGRAQANNCFDVASDPSLDPVALPVPCHPRLHGVHVTVSPRAIGARTVIHVGFRTRNKIPYSVDVTGPGASNRGCDAYESTFLTPDGYEADQSGGDFRAGAVVSASLDTSDTAHDFPGDMAPALPWCRGHWSASVYYETKTLCPGLSDSCRGQRTYDFRLGGAHFMAQ
jgi:hypothetical protein